MSADTLFNKLKTVMQNADYNFQGKNYSQAKQEYEQALRLVAQIKGIYSIFYP